MSTSERLVTLGIAVALSAAIGACSVPGFQPSDAPATDVEVAPALMAGAGRACDRSSPIQAFGLTHLPSGAAQLSLTPAGGLRAANIGSSGEDGVCTRLPDASRVHVALGGNQPGGFGPLGPGEAFSIALAGSNGWRQVCGVRGDASGRMDVGCHNADASGWIVQLVKNGRVVRSTRIDGSRMTLNLPGFVLSDFEWDGESGALTIEEIEEGVVLKGVMAIPVTGFPSSAVALTGMTTTLATPLPGREFVYVDYEYDLTGN